MPASVNTPLTVNPLMTVTNWFVSVRSLSNVTPSRVAVAGMSKAAPPDVVRCPPRIVPPASTKEPLLSSSASVAAVLSSVPTIFTTPPVRSSFPSPAVVPTPRRSSSPCVTRIVPAFVQVPSSARTAPGRVSTNP